MVEVAENEITRYKYLNIALKNSSWVKILTFHLKMWNDVMLVDNFKHYIVWGLTVNINSHLEYKSFADFGDAPPPTTASSNHCGELEEIVACTFFPTSVSPSCVKSTREVLAESFKSLQESRDYSSVILCYYSNTINNLIMSLCPWTFQLKTRRKLCTMKWKLKTNQLNKLRTQKVSHKKKKSLMLSQEVDFNLEMSTLFWPF